MRSEHLRASGFEQDEENLMQSVSNDRRRPFAAAWCCAVFVLLASAFCWAGAPAQTPELVEAKAAYHGVRLTGFTRPRRVMQLVSEESARCLEVLADVGDFLGEGGVFVRLNPTFVLLDIKKVEAEQSRVESEANYYDKQVGRYKTLVGGKTAAQQDLDDFMRLQAVAKDELQALRVQEMILREHLTRYDIKGPAGWRVIERFAEPGEWISTGQQVGTIGDFRTLLVPFALTEEEYEWIKGRANGLRLHFPAGGGTIPARLGRVSPDFDPQTRKIEVELEISGGLPEMRGGIRLELNLRSPDPAGVVLLPRQALMERYEEHFVLSRSGELIKVVYAGAADDGMVRVMSSRLKAGDMVRLDAKP